jgi:hypothetical protein
MNQDLDSHKNVNKLDPEAHVKRQVALDYAS